MTRITCHPHQSKIRAFSDPENFDVLQYGSRYESKSGLSIGNKLFGRIKRLGSQVSQEAIDFLSISIGVTAADTFIKRDLSADGWARQISLDIAVFDKVKWDSVKTELEAALHFLSGDMWELAFSTGGLKAPQPYMPPCRTKLLNLTPCDSVCLFSGGLDSTIGVLELLQTNHKPALVSHSYPKDKAKQLAIHKHLPQVLPLFAASLNPNAPYAAETSMRSRSINFLAFGAIVASALSKLNAGATIPLYIPENGFIALNPPLTTRRLGSLSTKTTHPHFLSAIQSIFNKVGLPVELINPFEHMTKGEMVSRHQDNEVLAEVAFDTVSCGKWKRKNMQCGRCVPCLIRRASFHAAEIEDFTPYREKDLHRAFKYEQDKDDILAMLLASKGTRYKNMDTWLSLSGPLPENRDPYLDVLQRGLAEVREYLKHEGFVV